MKKTFSLLFLLSLSFTACIYSGCPRAPQPQANSGQKAIAAVKDVFRLWHEEKFNEMAALVMNSGPESDFIVSMIKTPAHFQQLEVGGAQRNGAEWMVDVSVKVTEVASIMASIINQDRMSARIGMRYIGIVMPPDKSIELFRKIDQKMRVWCSDTGVCRVNICRGDDSCERHSNILNYVLDAGYLIRNSEESEAVAAVTSKGSDPAQARQAVWLRRAIMNIGGSEDDIIQIATQAMALYLKTPSGRIDILRAQMNRPDYAPPQEAQPSSAF
jgi:hypothetical protein